MIDLSQRLTGYDADLMTLTVGAFRIYSVAYLFMGFTYFGSSIFTSVENGKVSAVIAFVHTVIFEIGSVLLLPLLFGPAGIWWAISVAEAAATLLTSSLLLRFGVRYGWIGANGGEACAFVKPLGMTNESRFPAKQHR